MKSILITGATSGIGLATALLADKQGYRVTACGRSQQKLDNLFTDTQIETLCFDVTDATATQEVLQNQVADIYLLNAGVCEYIDLELDIQLFKRVFDCNFFGVIHCLQAIQHNLHQGNHIVLVDSLARMLPFSRAEAYGASKAALYYLCKSLSVDWQSKGVRLQSVSPGFVETPMTDQNQFEMPMRISVEQAAVELLKGIEANETSIYFPKHFSWIMRVVQKLPTAIQNKVSQYLKERA
jgi:NAD(P)-dependent dehydrogenase (short-subunit alcohol dehydrogenase family)